MIEKSVVFPAPLGPMSAVICPACAVSEAALTASKPPNLQVMPFTASNGSAMARLPSGHCRRPTPRQQLAHMREPADQAARHDPDDQHEHRTVDDEIETGRIARQKFCALAHGLDHEGTKQRSEYCADTTNDRGQ